MNSNLMNYQQTANFLGLAIGTLYSLVSRKQIPHRRLTGRLVRFDPNELQTWLDARAVNDSRTDSNEDQSSISKQGSMFQ